MAWYEFQITLSSDEHHLTERFLDIVHHRLPRTSPSSLWVSQREVRPGRPRVYYLESNEDVFVPLIEDLFGYPCEPPDPKTILPVAGEALNP